MADSILLVGDKYTVLDSQGVDYEKNKNIKRNLYIMRIFLNICYFSVSAMFAYFTYHLGTLGNPVLILTAIVTLLTAIFSFFQIDHITETFEDWQHSCAKYNAAMVNTQDAITKARYKTQEDLARHQANLKAISLEQKFSFQSKTEVEKNG